MGQAGSPRSPALLEVIPLAVNYREVLGKFHGGNGTWEAQDSIYLPSAVEEFQQFYDGSTILISAS